MLFKILHTYIYTQYILIYYPIILVFKYSISIFWVISFVISQKLEKNYVKNIFKFINRKVMHNQDKMCIKILIAVLILYQISSR